MPAIDLASPLHALYGNTAPSSKLPPVAKTTVPNPPGSIAKVAPPPQNYEIHQISLWPCIAYFAHALCMYVCKVYAFPFISTYDVYEIQFVSCTFMFANAGLRLNYVSMFAQTPTARITPAQSQQPLVGVDWAPPGRTPSIDGTRCLLYSATPTLALLG